MYLDSSLSIINSDSFSKFPSFIQSNLKSQKIQNFTKIQNEVIPALLSSRASIVALAPTGSGKTLAYVLPLLTYLYKNPTSRAIVVVPTRDLAFQVDKTIKLYCRGSEIRSITCIGQTSVNKDHQNLQKSPQVVIATPGRLAQHLREKQVRISGVDTLVFDEVDRLLDEGFKKEFAIIVEEYASAQKICFSATMATSLKTTLEKTLGKNYVIVDNSIKEHKKESIKQTFMNVEENQKFSILLDNIRDSKSSVVFVNTKFFARSLALKLNSNGKKAFVYTSDLSVNRRKAILEKFQSMLYSCIIATDVAARGIDFKDLSLVVNYHVPYRPSDYIHRIGRAGRGSNEGSSLTLISKEQTKFMENIYRFRSSNEQVIVPFRKKERDLPFKPFKKHSDSTKKSSKSNFYKRPR